jgi:hypothetical protein
MKKNLLLNIGVIFSIFTSALNFIFTANFFGTSPQRDIFLYIIMIITLIPQLVFGPLFENIRYNYLDSKIRIKLIHNCVIGRLLSLVLLINFLLLLAFILVSNFYFFSNSVYFAVLINFPIFFFYCINIISNNILYSHSNYAILINNIISSIIPAYFTYILRNNNDLNSFTIINYSFVLTSFVINIYFLRKLNILIFFKFKNPFAKEWYNIFKESLYMYLNGLTGILYRFFEMSFLLNFNNSYVSLFDYIKKIIDFIINSSKVLINRYIITDINNFEYNLNRVKYIVNWFIIVLVFFILTIYLLVDRTIILSLININVLNQIFNSNYSGLLFCIIFIEILNNFMITIFSVLKLFSKISVISSLQMFLCFVLTLVLNNQFGFVSFLKSLFISLFIACLFYYIKLHVLIKNQKYD